MVLLRKHYHITQWMYHMQTIDFFVVQTLIVCTSFTMQKNSEISAFSNRRVTFQLDGNSTDKRTVNSIKLDDNTVDSTLSIDDIKFMLYCCVLVHKNNDKYHCCVYSIDVIEIDCRLFVLEYLYVKCIIIELLVGDINCIFV